MTTLRRQRAALVAPTAQEQAALNAVTEKLIRISDETIDFVLDSIDPPAPGSPFAVATKADLRDAYDYAGHLIYATHDHLRTILAIIKLGSLPSYAMYTLLRPAAEAAVRAKHLLVPTISETERLARGLNERLDNLNEQRRAGADARDIAKRIDHLAKRATANGIAVKRSRAKPGRKRVIIGFGDRCRAISTCSRFTSALVRWLSDSYQRTSIPNRGCSCLAARQEPRRRRLSRQSRLRST